MKKSDVQAFFDRCAPTWDAHMVRSQHKIEAILDAAGVKEGVSVLEIKTRYLIQRNAA